jgi:hypothetical protein
MDVQEAVSAAKQWTLKTFQDETISNLGLEEVQYDGTNDVWKITLGFSRPWNSVRNALTAIAGEPAPRRTYKVVSISNKDGKVLSLTNKDSE